MFGYFCCGCVAIAAVGVLLSLLLPCLVLAVISVVVAVVGVAIAVIGVLLMC